MFRIFSLLFSEVPGIGQPAKDGDCYHYGNSSKYLPPNWPYPKRPQPTVMISSENILLVLGVIFFFGLIIPQFFKRLHLSFATSLIIVGAIMGPFGAGYVEIDETMRIFGFLGATFIMLLAGFETETLQIRRAGRPLLIEGLVSGILPFATGLTIAKTFGYSWTTSVFVGILFLSSSILLVFSHIQSLKLQDTKLGNTIESIVALQDLASAFLFFLVFKYLDPHHRFPLPVLLGLLISSVVILRMFVPEIVRYFFKIFDRTGDEYESKTRLLLALLFFIILIYAMLDVEPIIAAFLVGFILSEIPETEAANEKIGALGYAFFIPIYFFIVGLEFDWSLILELNIGNYLIMTIVAGALLSKLLAGWISGRMGKYNNRESLLIGILTSNKLTIAISGAYVGLQFQIIDAALYTGIITVSVLSTLFSPLVILLLKPKKFHAAHH